MTRPDPEVIARLLVELRPYNRRNDSFEKGMANRVCDASLDMRRKLAKLIVPEDIHLPPPKPFCSTPETTYL